MTSFSIQTRESAPIGSRDILAEIEGMAGFVPNVFGLIANSPVALAAIHSMNGFFRQSSFTPQEQEVIALTTSVENRCAYCIAGHTTFADALNVDPKTVADIRRAEKTANNKTEALRRFVSLLIRERGAVAEREIDQFLAQGFTENHVFELIIGVATKVVTNFASKIARIPVDDEFAANAWPNEYERGEEQTDTTAHSQQTLAAVGS